MVIILCLVLVSDLRIDIFLFGFGIRNQIEALVFQDSVVSCVVWI